MATTYNYQTGKIERDFKFIRYGEKCKRSGLPCYAGSTNRCEKCQHYGGLITPFEMREFTASIWVMILMWYVSIQTRKTLKIANILFRFGTNILETKQYHIITIELWHM